MKLNSLILRNFKGIEHFSAAASGCDLSVFGDNATGKTTIADALCWLLFGKDSLNRADFEIKTLDAAGQPKPRLKHEVEGDFDLDGKQLSLMKSYAETWVKTRGSAESEFSGHTTDYWINGVPVQKKEYDTSIQAICSEARFRILADPYFFNSHLSWQDRRKTLLEVCGDVSDEAVIASQEILKDLPAILAKRTLDEYRKIITARRPEVAKQMDMVPVRIDELRRSLADVPGPIDTSPIEARLTDLRAELATIRSGGMIAEKTKRLREEQGRRQELLNAAFAKASEAQAAETAKRREAMGAHEVALDRVNAANRNISQDKASKARLAAERDRLLAEHKWQSEKRWAGDENCGACGRPLPAEQVEEAKARFNQQRAEALERIVAAGKQTGIEIDSLNAAIDAAETALTELVSAEVASRVESAPPAPAAIADPEVAICDQKIAAVQAEIDALGVSNADAEAGVHSKIADAEVSLSAANEANARIASAKASEARIAELEAEHKILAAKHEKIARELHLCDEFIRAKVLMLTGKINGRFQIARFKLFDVQVNGGIAEVCETVVGGVPHGSLNHGMRLNAGLDIINTLSEHWGFAPPVLIDNAESVTTILPTRGQQIKLLVSAADKTLRIETAAGQKEAITA